MYNKVQCWLNTTCGNEITRLVCKMWFIANKMAANFYPLHTSLLYRYTAEWVPLFKATLKLITCHHSQQLWRFCLYTFHELKMCSLQCTFLIREVIKRRLERDEANTEEALAQKKRVFAKNCFTDCIDDWCDILVQNL